MKVVLILIIKSRTPYLRTVSGWRTETPNLANLWRSVLPHCRASAIRLLTDLPAAVCQCGALLSRVSLYCPQICCSLSGQALGWSVRVRVGENGSVCVIVGQGGSVRVRVGRCGSEWVSLGRCGPSQWVGVGQSGSVWVGVGQYGSVWVRVGQCSSEWVRMGQCGSEWVGVRQSGSVWVREGQSGSVPVRVGQHWVSMGHSGSPQGKE